MAAYILGVDQSTQGTKALLFDEKGTILGRSDISHRQIIDERGWVEHDPEEIYKNTVEAVRNVVEKCGVDKNSIQALGITNQRETVVAWRRSTGRPVHNAIVWQCPRGTKICENLRDMAFEELVREKTGLPLSPYFSAAKLAWIMQNEPEAAKACESGDLCMGTIDSFLVFRLTGGEIFRTDTSNASRTQLFDLRTLDWDFELCSRFGVPKEVLPTVTDSNGDFGFTDFEGFLDKPIPIRCIMGDSHAALFGQGCHNPGMIKVTYGTGSSIMMNTGDEPLASSNLAASVAWTISGKTEYVLEGNINFAGAVITWLIEDMKLISSVGECEMLAEEANRADRAYLVPAFTGLGAPYWSSNSRAILCGMSRTTGRAEVVRAGLESIALQVTDIINVMREESGLTISELRVDGGPTRNRYLMQFQSDMADARLLVPDAEELSAIGTAYSAGITLGIYDAEDLFSRMHRIAYSPKMADEEKKIKYSGWKEAIRRAL